jgi:hypothetical protein
MRDGLTGLEIFGAMIIGSVIGVALIVAMFGIIGPLVFP